MQQASQAGGVFHAGGGEQDPAFESVAHLVHLVLDRDDLASEPGVVVEEGGVREAHGYLGEVLHLDQDVYSPLELGELAPVLRRDGLERPGAGELTDLRYPLGRTLQKEHVASPEDVLGLRVEVPLVFPADGYGTH